MVAPRTVPLRPDSQVTAFESREPAIETFLRERANAFEEQSLARTYLLNKIEATDPLVLGFYCICMGALTTKDLPVATREALPEPPSSIPVAIIGQMGRDRRVPKERELGPLLVADVVARVVALAKQIGCWGIALDAMNVPLVGRYEKLGFRRIGPGISEKRSTQRMFMALGTATRAVTAAESAGPKTE